MNVQDMADTAQHALNEARKAFTPCKRPSVVASAAPLYPICPESTTEVLYHVPLAVSVTPMSERQTSPS